MRDRRPRWIVGATLALIAGLLSPLVVETPVSAASVFAAPSVIESRGGILEVTLVADARSIELNGEQVRARVFNGKIQGPTLVVSPGDRLEITLVNRLSQMTNLHTHGMFTSPRGIHDNVLRHIHPGETAQVVINIPADERPGLYWYHPHMHGLVEAQIFGGMSGLIVVRGIEELLGPELQDITQQYVALKDYQVVDGKIPAKNIDSGAPTTRLVNGQLDPTFTIAPGETQLWRLANIGADIWYKVRLPGYTFHVVGEDANPVWKVWDAKHLVLPPGKRYEVLVQGGDAGTTTLETLPFNQGKDGDQYPQATLAHLTVAGPAQQLAELPTGLVPDASLRGSPIARHRTMVFSEDPDTNEFYINGVQFDEDVVNVVVQRGTVEKWTLTNVSHELHPFHIHVNDFEVVRINGERYDAASWQDVVPIQDDGGSVTILMRFERYTGKYVFHCHIVAHEDNGMMQIVKVVA